MRALVVDDSSTIRQIIRQVLETEFQAVVVEAEDVREALAAPGPFDLVVTDLLMPGRDGTALIRELRARPGGATLPVVVVSVEVQPGLSVQVLDAGAAAFVGKPFRLRELADAVRAVLEPPEPGAGGRLSGTPRGSE